MESDSKLERKISAAEHETSTDRTDSLHSNAISLVNATKSKPMQLQTTWDKLSLALTFPQCPIPTWLKKILQNIYMNLFSNYLCFLVLFWYILQFLYPLLFSLFLLVIPHQWMKKSIQNVYLNSDSTPLFDIAYFITAFKLVSAQWLLGSSTLFASSEYCASFRGKSWFQIIDQGYLAHLVAIFWYLSDVLFFIVALFLTWYLRFKYATVAEKKPLQTLASADKRRHYFGRLFFYICESWVIALLHHHFSNLSPVCSDKQQLLQYLWFIELNILLLCNLRPLFFRFISLLTGGILSHNVAEYIFVTIITYISAMIQHEGRRQDMMDNLNFVTSLGFGIFCALQAVVFYLCAFIIYFRQTIYEHWIFQRFFKNLYIFLLAVCSGFILLILVSSYDHPFL